MAVAVAVENQFRGRKSRVKKSNEPRKVFKAERFEVRFIPRSSKATVGPPYHRRKQSWTVHFATVTLLSTCFELRWAGKASYQYSNRPNVLSGTCRPLQILKYHTIGGPGHPSSKLNFISGPSVRPSCSPETRNSHIRILLISIPKYNGSKQYRTTARSRGQSS